MGAGLLVPLAAGYSFMTNDCNVSLEQMNAQTKCVLGAGLLAPLAAGGAAIIPAGGKFSASTHWRDAVEHQATYYTAVPTMHQVTFNLPYASPSCKQDF